MKAGTPQTAPHLIRWIERGLMLLVAIMPLHAFLSISLGHFSGHQAAWQSWKELLIILLVLATVALLKVESSRLRRLHQPMWYCLGAFVAIGLVVTVWHLGSLKTAVYGLKTDFEFLVVAAIATIVASRDLVKKLIYTLLISSGLVIAFGCLQIFVLPRDWLASFGYGPDTIQPYYLVDPAIKAFRIVSTLGGPNQLGSFLILPLTLVGWLLLTRPRWWQPIYLAADLTVVWHTHGRATFLGLAAAFLIIALLRLPVKYRLPVLITTLAILVLTGQYVATNLSKFGNLQYYVLHQSLTDTGIAASTDQHLAAVKNGLKQAEQHPAGLGLGSAGPASLRGDTPLITESYYLQLAIETGVIGLLLFCAGQVLLGLKLWGLADQSNRSDKSSASLRAGAAACCAALLGIAVTNLFLHGWADSSTALVYWSLAGAVIGSKT